MKTDLQLILHIGYATSSIVLCDCIVCVYFLMRFYSQVLNYSARGGLSLVTDKVAHTSRLLVAKADVKDSGNYTCSPSGAHPTSVTVHVLNGK